MRRPREELKSVHRELDVLSQQYSHKCLESTHLAQALEAERLALRRCQRENRELNAHNQKSGPCPTLTCLQELNRQLREEISRIRSGPPAIGAGPSGTRSSERYEMEVGSLRSPRLLDARAPECLQTETEVVTFLLLQVLLHVKEAELQCLKQELCSLQDELQALLRIRHAARPDRSQSAERGAGDKHSSQLSVTKAQEEHLAAVMEARGVKCESSTGSQRKERNQSARSSRGVRSKLPPTAPALSRFYRNKCLWGTLHEWSGGCRGHGAEQLPGICPPGPAVGHVTVSEGAHSIGRKYGACSTRVCWHRFFLNPTDCYSSPCGSIPTAQTTGT
ncbi:hypothetical protein Z043_120165 [Scleropages formosus]|uniref:Uncharacterized protein n=1 Tax=Scleropages formosus TaxID=113540 RepID=A0A0P7UK04_SCLFO|nr:hypothetical protein Z043_120165 [Scleropages formosus]